MAAKKQTTKSASPKTDASKDAAANKGDEKEKVLLKFSGPYQRYAGGDIAGFDVQVAENILKLKPPVAEEYTPEEPE